MRAWIVAAVLVSGGCKFTSTGRAIDGSGDDGSNGGSGGGSGSGSDGPGPEAMPAAACMTSPDYSLAHGTHTYRALTDDKMHDEQVSECTKDGAHLVTIDDAGEDAFVSSTVDSGWIGLDDLTSENSRSGGSTGVAVSFRWQFPTTTTYANWNSGEPNDSNNAEDCVYTDGNASQRWNDTNCADQRHAVCECEPNVPAHPHASCMDMSGDIIDGRLYIRSAADASWDAALAQCAAMGAYLFTPADTTENGYIGKGRPIDIETDTWIGMSDHATLHQFAWANGSRDTYTHFQAAAPSLLDPSTTCVSMHEAGNTDVLDSYWTNRSCTEPHPFVCECDPWGPTN